MRWPVFAFAVLASCCPAVAGLKWDRASEEIKTKAADTEARAVYTFTNAGKSPVKITEVKTSCGCTAAEPDKRQYAPGEKGTLKAVMHLGNHTGRVTKKIIVHTDDPQTPRSELSITAAIPELVEMTPAKASWDKDEPKPQPKKVTVKVVSDAPLRLTGVRGAEPYIAAALKTIKEGEEYELTLTPLNTSMPFDFMMTLKTDLETKDGLKEIEFRAAVK